MASPSSRERELPKLAGPAEEFRYCEVIGERIALLGHESGVFECWMWPIKVCHDLKVEVRDAAGRAVELADRRVRVTPYELAFTLSGRGFSVEQRMFASREERALAILFERQGDVDLEIELSFVCDFRPMWPAGMGGQIGAPDRETGTFVLTEELGRFAVLLGGPEAKLVSGGADHALPGDPIRFRIPLPARRELRGPVIFAIAGAELDPGPLGEEARLGLRQAATGLGRAEKVVAAARALWRDLVAHWPAREWAQESHWRGFLERTTRLSSSDERHDQAFLWSKIAIERAWVRVDGLGRGLVAGLGPSRGGERPGFAWFFDGDAMVASRSMCACGDFEGAREVLRFAASHQRPDGKLMHELTLSARLCSWLEDYPYAYYKGVNAADFVAALDHCVRWSGDLDLARELFPHVVRAVEWCASCCNGQGLMSNRKAGLAAVEAGPLVDRIECDIFLQGAWLAALRGGERLGAALGEEAFRRRCAELSKKAWSGLAGLWIEEKGRYAFAVLSEGERADDLSAYLAYALLNDPDRDRARATAEQLNRPELASDWGLRMFAADSAVYDPQSYNTGAVFPYLTSFAILAQFALGLSTAGNQLLGSQMALWGFGGRGFVEEHLAGDLAIVPARGVPHQIFSSSTIVEASVHGWLGLAPDAIAGRLQIAASLPPAPFHARLGHLRVGASLVDLQIRREQSGEGSRSIYLMEKLAGPPLSISISQAMPPLSRVLRTTANGRPIAGSSAFELADRLEVAIDAREGPTVILPTSLPERGACSRNPRISWVRVLGEDEVAWSLHGPAGTRAVLPLHSDRACAIRSVTGGSAEMSGSGSLTVAFGPGEPDEFVETTVHLRLVRP
jgi:hypothetical protein